MNTKGVVLITLGIFFIFSVECEYPSTCPNCGHFLICRLSSAGNNGPIDAKNLRKQILENPNDFYKVLGVKRTSTLAEIQSAYSEIYDIVFGPIPNFTKEDVHALNILDEAANCLRANLRDPSQRNVYDQNMNKVSSNRKNSQSSTDCEYPSTCPNCGYSLISTPSSAGNNGPIDANKLRNQILQNPNDYYKVLGVGRTSTLAEIYSAYNQINEKLFGPIFRGTGISDKDTNLYITFRRAANCLLDDKQRSEYDQRNNPQPTTGSIFSFWRERI